MSRRHEGASEKNKHLDQKSWRGGRGSSNPWSTVHLLSSSFCELQDNTDEWSVIQAAGNIKKKNGNSLLPSFLEVSVICLMLIFPDIYP